MLKRANNGFPLRFAFNIGASLFRNANFCHVSCILDRFLVWEILATCDLIHARDLNFSMR